MPGRSRHPIRRHANDDRTLAAFCQRFCFLNGSVPFLGRIGFFLKDVLQSVFEEGIRRKPEWNGVATELRSLLTSEEYDSTRATTPNAHFTSPMVINAVWNGLEKLGLGKNVEVLEPAVGVGHFFGLMPDTLRGGHQTGVELDAITARIAWKLYPGATIFAQGFEATSLPDSYFDVVVGNVRRQLTDRVGGPAARLETFEDPCHKMCVT